MSISMTSATNVARSSLSVDRCFWRTGSGIHAA